MFYRSYNTVLATTSVPTTSKGAATLFCLRSFLTATAVSGCEKNPYQGVNGGFELQQGQREGVVRGDRRRGYPRASVADECG